MSELLALWLPMLLSAVFVFIVSSVIHMAIPIHKKDWKRLPEEDKVLATMREAGVDRGEYSFPFVTSMKDMGSEEMQKKYEEGPVGFLTVLHSGTPAMGASLGLWFVFSLIISLFAGYVTAIAHDPGAGFLPIFRVATTVAILPYAVAFMHDSIWKGRPWPTTLRFMFDGAVYALVTGATFGWLWPS